MKNTGRALTGLVVALCLLFPSLAPAQDVRSGFAPVVLTEECAAKAAYMHFVSVHDPVMLPEQTFRVVEVAPREGFYAVTIALVDKTNGGAVLRVAARIVVDGTSGDIVRFYLVPEEAATIEHLFDAATKPAVPADTLAGVVEAMNAREGELTRTILSELSEKRGDALERLARFLELLRARDRFLLELAEPVAGRIAEAAFGMAQAGELSLDRETIRLLGALRAE